VTPNECPQTVLAKLFALQSHAEKCGYEANAAENARDAQRTLLNRGPASMREHKTGNFNFADEQRKLDALTQRATAMRTAARVEAEVLQRCRAWIEALPNGTPLEPVNPKLDPSNTLQDVRARLQDIVTELKRLAAIPTPDPDLKRKVQAYVDHLAARAVPALRGIEQGAPLRAYWPADANANPRNLSGYDEFTGSGLLMFAWLQPGLLVDRLLGIANKMADELVPAAERPERIRQLQDEALVWRYVEEAIVCRLLTSGEAAVRDPATLPECVLQVKIRPPAAKKPSPSPTTVSRDAEMTREEAIGVSPG
jgi:hypothetical protein